MMISNNAFLSRTEMNLVHIHVYSLYFLQPGPYVSSTGMQSYTNLHESPEESIGFLKNKLDCDENGASQESMMMECVFKLLRHHLGSESY